MVSELRRLLATLFIMWAFRLCPSGKFKSKLTEFLLDNIVDL